MRIYRLSYFVYWNPTIKEEQGLNNKKETKHIGLQCDMGMYEKIK